ncbi:MAG: anti-sigma factor family protein [Paracoccaceae bacterium]
MTRPTMMDKDRLAAFVDGELSPEEAAAVVMHLADHPRDQAYVDDLTAANAALSRAFAAPLEEPVPDRFRDLILGSETKEAPAAQVLPFRPRSSVRSALASWGGLAAGGALAAGLALAVFLPSLDGRDLAPGPLAANSPLHGVLASLPSGEVQVLEDGAEVMILSSVPTPTGFCREIEVMRGDINRLEAALACTDGTGWSVEVVIVEDLADAAASEGFGTANGDEAQGFTPFLDRVGAGAFLSPEEEAAAIGRSWGK